MLGSFIWDGSKECTDFDGVKLVVGADAAAQVEAERLNSGDGVSDIGRTETTCEKERLANGVANASTQCPVVSAPGAAKLLDGETRVAGVEQ